MLDNFLAYTAGVEIKPPPPDSKIQVEFLSPNVTSLYQPLDQGIINSFKGYYRREYLVWLLEMLDKSPQVDPVKAIDVRRSLIWVSESWFSLRKEVINNCWKKSTLLGLDKGPSENIA